MRSRAYARVIPCQTIFQMYTIKGAEALALEDEIGNLEPGKKADIILLDWAQPHLVPTRNTLQAFVMAASARDICDVVVDGNFLLRNGRFTELDEESIIVRASESVAFARISLRDKSKNESSHRCTFQGFPNW